MQAAGLAIKGKICGGNHICGGNLKTNVGSKNRHPRFVHVITSKNFNHDVGVKFLLVMTWTNRERLFFNPIVVSKLPPYIFPLSRAYPLIPASPGPKNNKASMAGKSCANIRVHSSSLTCASSYFNATLYVRYTHVSGQNCICD